MLLGKSPIISVRDLQAVGPVEVDSTLDIALPVDMLAIRRKCLLFKHSLESSETNQNVMDGRDRSAAERSYLIEIASVEHPRLLSALLDEAHVRNIKVDRIAQGGGSLLLTDDELREMVDLGHTHGIDIYTYISSRNSFDQLADPNADDELRGEIAFADAVAELHRCAAADVDGVLIADVGLLAHAGELVRNGALGALKLKSAAVIAPRNAASAALYAHLGATSINTASSSTVDELAAMRAVLRPDVTLDVYVESPAHMGGGMRYRELPEIVRRLAPVSLKFGLRNAPALYPYGAHLEPMAESATREKVRRVELALARLMQTLPVA